MGTCFCLAFRNCALVVALHVFAFLALSFGLSFPKPREGVLQHCSSSASNRLHLSTCAPGHNHKRGLEECFVCSVLIKDKYRNSSNSVFYLLYITYILLSVLCSYVTKRTFDNFKGESINKFQIMFDT